MTRLALIRLDTKAVVEIIPQGLGRVALPGCGHVSPPVAGWTGGGHLTYSAVRFNAKTGERVAGKAAKGVRVVVKAVAAEGPARFGIVEVTDAVLPDGTVRDGPPSYAFDEGTGRVVETIPVTERAPAPPDMTAEEKLALFGLTRAELRALVAE